ncbi:MAG: adenylate/guanylate cyclase domain-containing protein [Nitrospirae bacterium]|nr:adenylate/guanylate cyclase domain-containing protein [Nitrospirota bacterium]
MYIRISPLEVLEQKLYDIRFKIRGKITPPPYVAIIAIDDKSLKKIGRWPWSRDKMAELTEILFSSGAKVIAFDILFAEPEKNDIAFAKAIKKAGNIILPIVFRFDEKTSLIDEDFLYPSSISVVKNVSALNTFPPYKAIGLLTCRKELSSSAKALGHINMIPDDDGTLRWEAMIIEYDLDIYPSIDLQIARVYQGLDNKGISLNATESIKLGDKILPTDIYGRVPIYYYGPEETFPYISVSDLFENKGNPDFLKGKIALVGVTALGIYDLRVTPFSANMPGVEKHANVITSLLEGRTIVKLPFITNLIILMSTGIILSIILSRLKAVSGAIVSFSLLFFLCFIGYYLLIEKGLWMNLSYPLINIFALSTAINVYQYAEEELKAKRIRAMFSSYVTEKIVNELTKNPDMAKLGGDRREVTVLFSDIKGFTSFSEKHVPEEVVSILNEYLTAMTEIIFKWEGTLDKFVGDEIVAFWGAPLPQKNHAELATRCALNMVEKLKELQKKWINEGKTPLDAGIGLNTGEVLVGNIGAEGKKMDYTVIGDNVNLGARIEALTRKYDVNILITEFTLEKIKSFIRPKNGQIIGHVIVKGLEKVFVKGKEKPVRVYEVKSLEPNIESRIIELND